MFKYVKTPKGLSNVGIGIVFAIAVYISAKHIFFVAEQNGQTLDTAIALPGILDIFGLFCAIKRRTTQARITRNLTATGMWGVLLISLWFNIEYALITNVHLSDIPLFKAVLISAIPALIITLAAEILTHVRSAPKKTASKAPSKPATAPTTPKVPAPRRSRSKAAAATTEPAIAS